MTEAIALFLGIYLLITFSGLIAMVICFGIAHDDEERDEIVAICRTILVWPVWLVRTLFSIIRWAAIRRG